MKSKYEEIRTRIGSCLVDLFLTWCLFMCLVTLFMALFSIALDALLLSRDD